jgi:hypothetical protein
MGNEAKNRERHTALVSQHIVTKNDYERWMGKGNKWYSIRPDGNPRIETTKCLPEYLLKRIRAYTVLYVVYVVMFS